MTNEKSQFDQAIEYLNKNDYTLAIVSFTEALEKKEFSSKIHYYLAICYSNLKYFKEALEEIDLAFNEDIDFESKLQLFHLKGYILFLQDKDTEALEAFKAAMNLEDNNQIAISGIAYYYFKKKDYKEAINYYQKAYEMAPDNAKNKNNYGYLLAMNNENLNKAKKLCEEALKSQPQNPAFLDSLAWSSYLLNNLKNAALAITKAFKLAPNIDDIKNHYSEISKKVKSILKKG